MAVTGTTLSTLGSQETHFEFSSSSLEEFWANAVTSFQPAVLLRDWPAWVGKESQLFVDNHLIHSMQGLKRSLHQPVKSDDNPILEPNFAWEGSAVWANGTIVKDPDSGNWRMYYKGWGSDLAKRQGKPVGLYRSPTCLAVSKDLNNWARPTIGEIAFENSTRNNIVFPDPAADTVSVIHDQRDPDPSRRWKALEYHYRYSPLEGPEGIYYLFSPDGLRWTRRKTPVMLSYVNWTDWSKDWPVPWPIPGVGDVNAVQWDPKLEKFIAHVKLYLPRPDTRERVRARGICESNDMLHWSPPYVTLIPDVNDPPDVQFYGNTAWPYESLWLGTLRLYHTEKGNVDLQLISSRDGRHWERVSRRPFIPNGPEGSYDEGYHTEFTNPPIRVGDELLFFYGSTVGPGKKASIRKGGICVATLRADGFVSLNSTTEPGWVMTRPLNFEGRRLFLNTNARQGEIRTEILSAGIDSAPKVLYPHTRSSCLPIREDGVKQMVRWEGRSDLEDLAGKTIRLKFYLRDAELYSFSIL